MTLTPTMTAFVEHALDSLDSLDESATPQITYIAEQILAENREDGDITLLFNRGKEILKQQGCEFKSRASL